MHLSRREFLQMLAIASASGMNVQAASRSAEEGKLDGFYQVPRFGNVSLFHYTDCHAQLLPVYFREPNINLGVAGMFGQPPHLVGDKFLEFYGIKDERLQHAFTYLNFADAAQRFGKVGGFAHLKTLLNTLRAERPGALMLDGGDTWQGSGTSLWTNAQDMVDAQKLLGVNIMTPHWEMTYGAERVQEIIANDFAGVIDFVAQNVVDKDWMEHVFKPYVIKEINGVAVAIIGQAFPYTPIANPRYMVPDWSFGIRDETMQDMVNQSRDEGAQVVVVLSHNGMDVDLKMASRVSGIDVIFGGHTHDGVPQPVPVKNSGGVTLVTNAGSNSKFLGVMDLDVRDGKVKDFRYHLLPVFSNLIPADAEMQNYINTMRQQEVTYGGETFVMEKRLQEKLAVTDDVLYRRGNFNGTFDQLICDALIEQMDCEISFSPGFRWGVSVLPGEAITMEHVLTQTAITYPTATRNAMTGEMIKTILEDVADNLFNKDPYYQQGGDMVRVGGLEYTINPSATIGNRISEMRLNGQAIESGKNYIVGGWASVAQPIEGKPVWDVVADYLRDKKTIKNVSLNTPKIIGQENDPGIAM